MAQDSGLTRVVHAQGDYGMRKKKKSGLTRVLHVQADYDELCAVAEEDDVENDPAYQMMLVSL